MANLIEGQGLVLALIPNQGLLCLLVPHIQFVRADQVRSVGFGPDKVNVIELILIEEQIAEAKS